MKHRIYLLFFIVFIVFQANAQKPDKKNSRTKTPQIQNIQTPDSISFTPVNDKIAPLEQKLAETQAENTELNNQLIELKNVKTENEELKLTLNECIQQNSKKDTLIETLNQMKQDLQLKNEQLQKSSEAFNNWLNQIIVNYNTRYNNISQTSLSNIDVLAIDTTINSVDGNLFSFFPDKEKNEIKIKNQNLKNLKSIVSAYIDGNKLLKESANKTAISGALNKIKTANNQVWVQQHKNDIKQLSDNLNYYGKYIDNFSQVLQMVENYQAKPEFENLAPSYKDEKIGDLRGYIDSKIGLVADKNYPKVYSYLNSILAELRNSLSQFPTINISALRTKLNK